MRTAIPLAVLLLAATPAPAAGRREPPPGHATGAPISCISATRLGSSERYGDRTILFQVRPGRYFRNDLPNSCPNLSAPGTAIAYAVQISQLCSGDIFRVVDTTAPGAGYGSCTFGKFTPWEKDRPAKER